MIKVFFNVGVHDHKKIEDGQVIGDDILENMLLVITKGEGTANILRCHIKMLLVKITNAQVVIVRVADLRARLKVYNVT